MKNKMSVILGQRKQRISDVVKNTGCSRNAATNIYYERDCNPSYKTLKKISDYLEVSVSEFLNVPNTNEEE